MNLLFDVLAWQLDRPKGNASIQNYPGTPTRKYLSSTRWLTL